MCFVIYPLLKNKKHTPALTAFTGLDLARLLSNVTSAMSTRLEGRAGIAGRRRRRKEYFKHCQNDLKRLLLLRYKVPIGWCTPPGRAPPWPPFLASYPPQVASMPYSSGFSPSSPTLTLFLLRQLGDAQNAHGTHHHTFVQTAQCRGDCLALSNRSQ